MELPPGFRFHPTDEELISHYLSPKAKDTSFSATAIGEVDLNMVEPWDLPWRAKMGEREWYFFCVRDRKYPTGQRTNRATRAGYWKATGKDKEIMKVETMVGMKKTLVFYKGRAPRGEKTNWVMHEYRLQGKNSIQNAKNEWVICRIFKKTSGGHKIHISALIRGDSSRDGSGPSTLPPLMDISQRASCEALHVTCFSDSMDDQKPQTNPAHVTLGLDSGMKEDHSSVLRVWLENNGLQSKHDYDDGGDEGLLMMSSAAGPVDLECLWNY